MVSRAFLKCAFRAKNPVFWVFLRLKSSHVNSPLAKFYCPFWKKVSQRSHHCFMKFSSLENPGMGWAYSAIHISYKTISNVNARSNLAGIIRVFGHVVRDLQRNHPTAARDVMRTTRVRSKVERSRACAPLTKTQTWDSGFFVHALFVPKTPNVMGFSGSVNGTTKNPGFLDFGFCQCKWA